ncbi:RDD family protein [Brevibacillus porteri]|uniref:RDD family protein n=1 Tax=Brevibacillus porteri TaxID=2126350 RepID=A0ABX5FID4_9BACL|nr:RDD family protein [Brevibacillus porteri]MED1801260.1 RDD family protein [Brevibacillus porteri]MED2129889.1 RDD family protein [Brevibacillus porteri]MED2746818.1 RDD family protein [Brevibacillus porteri]MED2815968.1 RDD family protein [Brevibacillus porteri]MED2895785.1 RDD family protein [Brevibacillus porteri]
MEQQPSSSSVPTEFSPLAQQEPPKNMGDLSKSYDRATIFFTRWGAHILDHILLACFLLGLLSLGISIAKDANALYFFILAAIILCSYYVLLEGLTGYTIGKFTFRIIAVNAEGQPPGLWKSFIRSLIRLFEANAFLLGGLPAGISVLASDKRQRLGDLAANTYVVKVKDLNNVSKKQTTVLAVVFSSVAVLSIISMIFGIIDLASKTPTEEIFYSKDKKLQITAPSDWSKDSALHDEADIAISNRISEKYLLILSDAKQNLDSSFTLQDYADFVEANIEDSVENVSVDKPIRTVVNNQVAIQFNAKGEGDGVKIAYIVTVFETPTHFYQIMAWTEQKRFDSLKQELQKVSASFREVK